MSTLADRQRLHRDGLKSKLDRMETKLDALVSDDCEPDKREHAEIFCKWLRAPNDHGILDALKDIEGELSGRAITEAEKKLELAQRNHKELVEASDGDLSDRSKRIAAKGAGLDCIRAKIALEDARKRHEIKDVTIADGPSGGIAVPALIYSEIARQAVTFSPFRRLCTVETVGSSDFAFPVEIPGMASGWVGETDTRTETDSPRLREQKPLFGEVYANVQVSEWALDDIQQDVLGYLNRSAATQFAMREAIAVINGTGVKQPKGILSEDPSLSGDGTDSPVRDADSIQYLAVTDSPADFGHDDLVDLSTSVADEYLEETDAVAWVMRRSTLGRIRKLKDTAGHPILIESANRKPLLLGYPVECTAAADEPGDSPLAFPILFGNWKRGYGLVDRGGIRVTPDNMTAKGFINFHIRRRVGGRIIDNNAIKALSF